MSEVPSVTFQLKKKNQNTCLDSFGWQTYHFKWQPNKWSVCVNQLILMPPMAKDHPPDVNQTCGHTEARSAAFLPRCLRNTPTLNPSWSHSFVFFNWLDFHYIRTNCWFIFQQLLMFEKLFASNCEQAGKQISKSFALKSGKGKKTKKQKTWLLSTRGISAFSLTRERRWRGGDKENKKLKTNPPNVEQNGSVAACPVESKSPEAPRSQTDLRRCYLHISQMKYAPWYSSRFRARVWTEKTSPPFSLSRQWQHCHSISFFLFFFFFLRGTVSSKPLQARCWLLL